MDSLNQLEKFNVKLSYLKDVLRRYTCSIIKMTNFNIIDIPGIEAKIGIVYRLFE